MAKTYTCDVCGDPTRYSGSGNEMSTNYPQSDLRGLNRIVVEISIKRHVSYPGLLTMQDAELCSTCLCDMITAHAEGG